jgi:hypothetical protein
VTRVRRAAAFAAGLGFVVALPTLRNGFVMDDRLVIVDNLAVRSLAALPRFFAGPWAGGLGVRYYRPLALTLYTLEHAVFGVAPWGFHLVSAVLHAVMCCLCTLLVARVCRSVTAAWWGGALFAVHPVHSEAIAAACYQTTLLAGVLASGALLVFGRILDRGLGAWRLGALALLATAAIMAKEEAYALPALAAAWVVIERPPKWRRRGGVALLLLGAATIVLLLARRELVRESLTFFGDAPRRQVVLTMIAAARLYAELCLLPLKLCVFYDWFLLARQDQLSGAVLAGLALLVALTAGIALALRRARPAAIGLSWLVLGLLPVLQLVAFIIAVAERFLYLPTVGLAIAAGAGMMRAGRAARVAVATLLVAFAARTVIRLPDFHDDRTLNRATARDFPETPTPLLNLAEIEEASGDVAAARAALEEAARRAPGWPVVEARLAALRAREAAR